MVSAQMGETGGTTSIIVCPTPAGGHIEHACDLAVATYRTTGRKATVLTRPGAKDYLPQAVLDLVAVFEVIPPLPGPRSNRRRYLEPLLQIRNLITEHLRIRRVVASIAGPKVLVLEEPRYPLPQLLTARAREMNICLIVHNAVEHAQSRVSMMSRLRARIGKMTKNQVTFIAVHGDRQMRLVSSSTSVPVKSFPLPGASYVNSLTRPNMEDMAKQFPRISEKLVCLGELRANKGIEVAIEASRNTNVPLLVLGKAVDREYLEAISTQAGGVDTVELMPQFVSPESFDYVLDKCRAILLPYSQFDAQSGVLARAMDRGTSVLASDLPSLREQAGNSSCVSFFEPGSAVDLARVFESLAGKNPRIGRGAASDDEPVSISEWDNFANAVQSGW